MSAAVGFEVGEVVRYAKGAAALMRIDAITFASFRGKRVACFHGVQCMGVRAQVYAHDCTQPNADDMGMWHAKAGLRSHLDRVVRR